MTIYHKGSGTALDYMIDWGPGWLRGATIAASRWAVEGPEQGGMTARTLAAGEGRTAVALSGGRPGDHYTVRGEVRLSDGRCARRSLQLAIGGGR